MRKSPNIMRQIMSIITLMIWAAVIIALLMRFDWDVVAVIEWIGTFIYNVIMKMANMLFNNETFRTVTS